MVLEAWIRSLAFGCALACSLAVLSSLATASPVPPAYFDAASLHQVPPEVLYAVATAESVVSLEVGRRPWPWTLNVAGEGFHFATRQAACEALTLALQETRVVDVGITQLNVRWQPQLFGAGKRFAQPCDALNPYTNLEEAARLLRGHYEAFGDWVQAAGRYHRPAGGEPAARYRRIVAAELERLKTSRQRQLAAN